MRLNPFKDSNLNNLQSEITEILSFYLYPVLLFIQEKWNFLKKYGNERITIMVVPHTEHKIINFHLPVYAIIVIVIAIMLGLTITSITIINHAYNTKNVSKLLKGGIDSENKIREYKKEIDKLYDYFQQFKQELSEAHLLIFQDSSSSLWAKGGEANPAGITGLEMESPSIEELNMREIEQELKITRNALEEIKKFLNGKKILENTPSIRPVSGYIISSSGKSNNSENYDNGFYRGVEIAAYPGSKIIATAPGKVENITWDKSLGLTVTIQHKYGYTSIFSHCKNVVVKINQSVKRGQTIAYTGKTGDAPRYMCFYQIRIGNEFVDPYPYIK